MNPEKSLARGKVYLDEATENLTFDEFDWAFEEVWHGVAWVLNALFREPRASVETGEKGKLPTAGSLSALLSQLAAPPRQAKVVHRLEALHPKMVAAKATGKEVADLIFAAWELHDACGERLQIVDERLGNKMMLSEASPGRVASLVVQRRTALKLLAAGSIFPMLACKKVESDNRPATAAEPEPEPDQEDSSPSAAIKAVTPIGGMHWKTSDPFLFCAHHRDDYPEGNEDLGPAASLAGRHLGRDFDEGKDWRMYHGRKVPGFPRHPHRGFETVTVVRTGFLDHADSLGATARYGGGDVQWLTSGGGIQHAEMFPLLDQDSPNPLELFQIWLNLRRSDKMVDPYFTMLWNEKIPRVVATDDEGRIAELTIVAGSYGGEKPPAPPPNSWAARSESDIAIWKIRLQPGVKLELPRVLPGTLRSLYVHRGEGVSVAGRFVPNYHRVEVEEQGTLQVEGGPSDAEVLLLQGRPIGEPVAQRGPFVMNTQDEIRQAYADYQQTAFGGWTWADDGPVHDGKKGRFAIHVDGTYEEPG